jgi:hypothetical protein
MPLVGRLYRLLQHGLDKTAEQWPPLEQAYVWVQAVAHALANHDQRPGSEVQADVQRILAVMQRDRATVGKLATAVDHFRAVTASYGANLFVCYAVPAVPRTDNALEQFFGQARHQERRVTGRKRASPALVVRGAVRVVAAVLTKTQPLTATALRPRDLATWRDVRLQVDQRHDSRRQQARFRKAPAAYLASLEARFISAALPS